MRVHTTVRPPLAVVAIVLSVSENLTPELFNERYRDFNHGSPLEPGEKPSGVEALRKASSLHFLPSGHESWKAARYGSWYEAGNAFTNTSSPLETLPMLNQRGPFILTCLA